MYFNNYWLLFVSNSLSSFISETPQVPRMEWIQTGFAHIAQLSDDTGYCALEFHQPQLIQWSACLRMFRQISVTVQSEQIFINVAYSHCLALFSSDWERWLWPEHSLFPQVRMKIDYGFLLQARPSFVGCDWLQWLLSSKLCYGLIQPKACLKQIH